jgi:uncharacterized protein (DUF1684 family)
VRRFVLAAALLLLTACNPKAPDQRDYVARLAAARLEKDQGFQRASGPSAPIPDNRKALFLPLEYYPIDPTYDVPAVLKPSNDKTIVQMSTSTGQPRAERRAGTLEFSVQGQALKLTAFVEADAPNMDRLFVPFADQTTGSETYSGGRYLDLDRTATGFYDLDFNKAYHPYCLYNPLTECPFPPPENRLPIPVRAGERLKVKAEKAEGKS